MRKWITLVVVLALLGGRLTFLIIGKTRAERAAYLAALEAEDAMKACAEEAAAQCARLRHASERLREDAAALHDALLLANSAVEFVTGEPEAKPAEPKPKPGPKAPAPQVEPAAERPARSLERDGELPAGMLSREALEWMRNRGAQPRPKAQAPEEEAGGTAPSVEPVTVDPVPREPEARTVQLAARELKTLAQQAQSIVQDAADIADRSLELERKVVRATDSGSAASRLEELESLFDEMDDCKARMQEALPELEKLRDEVEGFTMMVARTRNASAAERLRRLAKEDREQREAADLTRLEKLRQDQKSLLTTHAYARLAKVLEEAMASCQSEKGRAAFAASAERCAKINWLKGYIIEQIQAEPMRWGWGLGAEMVDVTDASETGVTVRGREIGWPDVPVAQFAKWARLYCGEYELPARVLGALELAMGAFLWEHDRTEEALDYKRKSIQTWEHSSEEADRLLPES